jgi:hypothetical protein
VQPSLDADLIAIGEQHIAAYNAGRECKGNQAAHDVLFERYMQTVFALDNAKPQTIAGMVAKARSARHEAMTQDGTCDTAHSQNATGWAWDILNDLLRLFGDTNANHPETAAPGDCIRPGIRQLRLISFRDYMR